MESDKSQQINKKENFWKPILVWGLLAILLRWQVLEPRWIPSGSMLPTLQIQDRILVEKIKPRVNLALHKHLKRSTLVIFKPPQPLINAGYDKNEALIKRVVGIPGDEIEVHEGKLFRNKEIVEEPWIKERIRYEMKPIIVPLDSLWVLGDNRNNSLDSHLWGPLPESNVIGTAVFKYWPLNKAKFIRFPTH